MIPITVCVGRVQVTAAICNGVRVCPLTRSNCCSCLNPRLTLLYSKRERELVVMLLWCCPAGEPSWYQDKLSVHYHGPRRSASGRAVWISALRLQPMGDFKGPFATWYAVGGKMRKNSVLSSVYERGESSHDCWSSSFNRKSAWSWCFWESDWSQHLRQW